MSEDKTLSPEEFGALFKGFLEEAVGSAPSSPPYFLGRLEEHLGQSPARLPTVREEVEQADHPNLQLAIESLRKAALFAADEAEDAAIEDRHIDAALHELAVQGGELLRSLLGVRDPAGEPGK